MPEADVHMFCIVCGKWIQPGDKYFRQWKAPNRYLQWDPLCVTCWHKRMIAPEQKKPIVNKVIVV